MLPRRPEARSPGPSGPDEFSPTGGSWLNADRTDADIRSICHWISSWTASGRLGAASPAALAAYAAAPNACAPMCGMLAACPAARAAATAAGALTARVAPPAKKRRRISAAILSSPRANARVRVIASRGRRSSGASASNNPSTRSAQSAAQLATSRRSASLSVCGEATRVTPLAGARRPSSRDLQSHAGEQGAVARGGLFECSDVMVGGRVERWPRVCVVCGQPRHLIVGHSGQSRGPRL